MKIFEGGICNLLLDKLVENNNTSIKYKKKDQDFFTKENL